MKPATWALAAVLALSAVGCGWQSQNLQGNHCMDGSCTACRACNNNNNYCDDGGMRSRIGNGQLAARARAAAQMGPPHVQGDFLSNLHGHNQNELGPLPGDGSTPTASYPYYTTRGPRDFFVNDPRPIGY